MFIEQPPHQQKKVRDLSAFAYFEPRVQYLMLCLPTAKEVVFQPGTTVVVWISESSQNTKIFTVSIPNVSETPIA